MNQKPQSSAARIPLLALLPLTIVGCTELPVGERADIGADNEDDDTSGGERDLGFDPEEMEDTSSTPLDTTSPPAADVATDTRNDFGVDDSTSAHTDVMDVTSDATDSTDGSAASDTAELDTSAAEDVATDAATDLDSAADTGPDVTDAVADATVDADADADAGDTPDADIAPYRPEATPGTLFADFLDALTPGTLQTYCEELADCDGPYDSVEQCVGYQYSYAEYVLARAEYFYGYFAYDCGLALGVFYDCYYAYKYCGDDGTMDYASEGDDCVDEYFFRYYACNPFA